MGGKADDKIKSVYRRIYQQYLDYLNALKVKNKELDDNLKEKLLTTPEKVMQCEDYYQHARGFRSAEHLAIKPLEYGNDGIENSKYGEDMS